MLKSEDRPNYWPEIVDTWHDEEMTIGKALGIINHRLRVTDMQVGSPRDCKDYLTLKLANLPHEVFACMWLDSQNRLIKYSELFRGTLTKISVYPREVVKEALRLNAGGVILAHNHPSGLPEPSRSDESITQDLKKALALVDVKVLDHIIVAGADTVSFAERGLL